MTEQTIWRKTSTNLTIILTTLMKVQATLMDTEEQTQKKKVITKIIKASVINNMENNRLYQAILIVKHNENQTNKQQIKPGNRCVSLYSINNSKKHKNRLN